VRDETRPEDAGEHHVVRQGVDQDAIVRRLERWFSSVELRRYWSTQAGVLHRLGQRMRLENTFGIEAMGLGGQALGKHGKTWNYVR
jgi:hypothetical protein